jgi:hypothetical protein
LCNLSIPLAFETLFNVSRPHYRNSRAAQNFKILFKILLPAGETSLKGLKVFYDCSGGNSRPSRLSGVGGGNFLAPKVRRFLLARDLALARLRLNRNGQRRTSDVEIRKALSRCMASRIDACSAHHWNDDSDHLLAFGELAGTDSAAKHG